MTPERTIVYVRAAGPVQVAEQADLVGVGPGALEAVKAAAEHSELVGQLVLVGARGDIPEAEQVQCLTLIVQGSEDDSDAGRRLKKRIRSSYLCYVYGAGPDVEADQPARLKNLIHEFLERGEAFIINWKEQDSSGS